MCLQAANTDRTTFRLKLQGLAFLDCPRKKCSGHNSAEPFHDERPIKRHTKQGVRRVEICPHCEIQQRLADLCEAFTYRSTYRQYGSAVFAKKRVLQKCFDGMNNILQLRGA